MAGSTTAVVAASVRNNGLVLVYGALAGFKLELGVADLLFRGVRVHGFWCAVPGTLPCRAWIPLLALVGCACRHLVPFFGALVMALGAITVLCAAG